MKKREKWGNISASLDSQNAREKDTKPFPASDSWDNAMEINGKELKKVNEERTTMCRGALTHVKSKSSPASTSGQPVSDSDRRLCFQCHSPPFVVSTLFYRGCNPPIKVLSLWWPLLFVPVGLTMCIICSFNVVIMTPKVSVEVGEIQGSNCKIIPVTSMTEFNIISQIQLGCWRHSHFATGLKFFSILFWRERPFATGVWAVYACLFLCWIFFWPKLCP